LQQLLSESATTVIGIQTSAQCDLLSRAIDANPTYATVKRHRTLHRSIKRKASLAGKYIESLLLAGRHIELDQTAIKITSGIIRKTSAFLLLYDSRDQRKAPQCPGSETRQVRARPVHRTVSRCINSQQASVVVATSQARRADVQYDTSRLSSIRLHLLPTVAVLHAALRLVAAKSPHPPLVVFPMYHTACSARHKNTTLGSDIRKLLLNARQVCSLELNTSIPPAVTDVADPVLQYT